MADQIEEKKPNNRDFVEVNALIPTGPARELFIAGASVFEITDFTPPIQRVTILGINLPNPNVFGPYDSYVATLFAGGNDEPLETLYLVPTTDNQNWVESTLLDFGGTLPNIKVLIRPSGVDHIGDVILRGPVFP